MTDHGQPAATKRQRLALRAAFAMLAIAMFAGFDAASPPIDFDVCWQAARAFVEGRDPYAVHTGLRFVYPPGSLYLLAPIGALGAMPALLVWTAALATAVVVAAVGWARLTRLDVPGELAVGIFLLMFPVVRAFEPLNLVLLFPAVCLLCATRRPLRGSTALDVAACASAGFLLAFKPHWLLVGGALAAIRHRWSALAGLVLGTGVMGALSLTDEALLGGFRENAAWTLSLPGAATLWTISPYLGAAAVTAWLGVVAYLCVRPREFGWLWAFTAVLVWPRPVDYAYITCIPLAMFLVPRTGWPTKVATALLSVPAWLLLVASVNDQGISLNIGMTEDRWFVGPMYLVMALVFAVQLLRVLRREQLTANTPA